jgi:hypothetical protein
MGRLLREEDMGLLLEDGIEIEKGFVFGSAKPSEMGLCFVNASEMEFCSLNASVMANGYECQEDSDSQFAMV